MWVRVYGSDATKEEGAGKYLYTPVEVHLGAREVRKSCITSMFMQELMKCGGCLGD